MKWLGIDNIEAEINCQQNVVLYHGAVDRTLFPPSSVQVPALKAEKTLVLYVYFTKRIVKLIKNDTAITLSR